LNTGICSNASTDHPLAAPHGQRQWADKLVRLRKSLTDQPYKSSGKRPTNKNAHCLSGRFPSIRRAPLVAKSMGFAVCGETDEALLDWCHEEYNNFQFLDLAPGRRFTAFLRIQYQQSRTEFSKFHSAADREFGSATCHTVTEVKSDQLHVKLCRRIEACQGVNSSEGGSDRDCHQPTINSVKERGRVNP